MNGAGRPSASAQVRDGYDTSCEESGGRYIVLLVLGGLIAYFLLDEQRRDNLLDRLTGASGPIETSTQSVYNQASQAAQNAANQTTGPAQAAAQDVADAASEANQ